MSYYLEKEDGLWLFVRVQPRASRTCLDGVVDGRLRVRLSAPPVDNAANAACLEVLASVLEVPRRDVTLMQGHKAREKAFRVAGAAGALRERLEAALAKK